MLILIGRLNFQNAPDQQLDSLSKLLAWIT